MEVNRRGILIFFILTGLISLGFWLIWGVKQSLSSTTSSFKFPTFKVSYIFSDPQKDTSRGTSSFIKDLRSWLAQKSGTYAVYVYRLNDHQGYGLNEDMTMPAASIMKVPIATAIYRRIQSKEFSWDDQYLLQEEHKRTGSGPIEFMATNTPLTLKDLLTYMGKNSDNTAPVALLAKLAEDTMGQELKNLGMDNSDFYENTITAYDTYKAWEYVYAEPELWPFFEKSIYEDRISLGLPESVQFIHKVGSDEKMWADGGVIKCSVSSVQPARNASQSDAGGCSMPPLIMVILNKDVDLEEAKEVVPEIARKIMTYELEHVKQQLPPPTPLKP